MSKQDLNNKIQLGSKTAKDGFKNEKIVVEKFNNYKFDVDSQQWLSIMNYNFNDIEYLNAEVINGYKADLIIRIKIKLKNEIDIEKNQVKLVGNKKGFNQVDKRWLNKYKELWNIPDNVLKCLQYFTGELKPYKKTKSDKRMFINELNQNEQDIIINWFDQNKELIINDILKGKGEYSASWFLVIQKENIKRWSLKNIDDVIAYYLDDKVVKITPRGSLSIGKVTIQRKGGDNGRETAKMLQLKIDPTKLFDI